jgi:5,10-methylenetetrahydromethanopterin reductase
MRPVSYGFMVFSNLSVPKVVEQVKVGEEVGFDSAWLLDSQLVGREVFVALAASALATSRIRLGPGVTHTATRHPSVLASGFASLAEVAPGRINLAIGYGDSAIRGLGGKPVKLAQYREDFELIRSLLAGKKVPYNSREIKLAWSNPQLTSQIPLYSVPGGPKGMELAGELGAGAVLLCREHELQENLQHLTEGAKRGGKALKDLDIIWWATTCISEDWSKVREYLAPRVASNLRHSYYDYKRGIVREDELPAPLDLTRRIAEEYNFLEHATAGAEHGKLLDSLPDDVFKRGLVAGSPREAATVIRRVVEAYPEIRQVVWHIPVGTPRLSLVDILRTFANEVKPLLQ